MEENRHGVEKRRHDDKKKADLQSEQFMSVYVKEDVENIPRLGCFFKVNFAVHYSGPDGLCSTKKIMQIRLRVD